MKVQKSKVRSKVIVPPVPKRPLTAYNLFYILERNYLVQQHQKASPSLLMGDDEFKLDPERPQKYRSIVLPSNWYVVGMNRTKRSDYKNHGLISFAGLSKTISEMWKEVEEDVKAYCKKLASEEMKRYRREQEIFKEKYGEEAFLAQKKKYNKRPKDMSDTSHSRRTCQQCDEDDQDKVKCKTYAWPHVIEIENASLHKLDSNTSNFTRKPFFLFENNVTNNNAHKRRGSGDISELSIGEWIMTGQEAAKAFDDDDIFFRT